MNGVYFLRPRLGRRAAGYMYGLILFCLVLAGVAACEVDPCASAPFAHADLSLHLALMDGRHVFHQGEIIPLIATYHRSGPVNYEFDDRRYDRVGRLHGLEIFCVTPAKGVDPLADYFRSGFYGLGGLSSITQPYWGEVAIPLQLNEWLSLPPGHYHLSVVGARVGAPQDPKSHEIVVAPLPLRSNAVEFDVIPADAAWQAKTLAHALQVLNAPKNIRDEFCNDDDPHDDKCYERRVLRFLGSEASTRVLARRMCMGGGEGADASEAMLGLYGSPNRAIAIDEMAKLLDRSPRCATEDFVDALVALQMSTEPQYRAIFDGQPWTKEQEKELAIYEGDHDRRSKALLAEAQARAASKKKTHRP